jgi:hypothetical protein
VGISEGNFFEKEKGMVKISLNLEGNVYTEKQWGNLFHSKLGVEK